MTAWESAKRRYRQRTLDDVRRVLLDRVNQTANFLDERDGIDGGTELRVLARASGECLVAVRVESS